MRSKRLKTQLLHPKQPIRTSFLRAPSARPLAASSRLLPRKRVRDPLILCKTEGEPQEGAQPGSAFCYEQMTMDFDRDWSEAGVGSPRRGASDEASSSSHATPYLLGARCGDDGRCRFALLRLHGNE